MAFNHPYHALVQETDDNKVLSEAVNGLRRRIRLQRCQIYHPNRLGQSIQDHHKIRKAFRKRNPGAAEEHMKKHLNRQFQAPST